MARVSYKGPHVVLSEDEVQKVFDILPKDDPEYKDLIIKFNTALDKEWEERQYPKGRVT